MRGSAYVSSLKDGREVWYGSERVGDVAAHPVIGRCVANKVAEYDHHAAEADDGVCPAYEPPRSAADLQRYRDMLQRTVRDVGGGVCDHPHVGWHGGIGMVLITLVATADGKRQKAAEAIRHYHEAAARNDLTLAGAFSGPEPGPEADRGLLRVVSRTDGGMVVRGIRRVATGAAYAHHLFVIGGPEPGATQPMAFAVKVATPGLKVICRPGTTDPGPLSGYDELDAVIVLDDVFVPWEQVFALDDAAAVAGIMRLTTTYPAFSVAVTAMCRFGYWLGLAQLLAGPSPQGGRADDVSWLVYRYEALRALVDASVARAQRAGNEMVLPAPAPLCAALHLAVASHDAGLDRLRRLAGSSVLTAPEVGVAGLTDLDPWLRAAFGGGDAARRLALLEIVRDATSSPYAARWRQFTANAVGSESMRALRIAQSYPNLSDGVLDAVERWNAERGDRRAGP